VSRKGEPESSASQSIIKQAEEMAGDAARVIAFARKSVPSTTPLPQDEAENGLTESAPH
jgi:hypothetical protein